jgi:enoyl-CoA hydratase/carnithine racemase
MSQLADYRDRYPCLRMSREDGVLHVALHTGGGSFAFDETTHHDLGAAFDQIGADPGNRVIILTGTGDRFCADFDYGSAPGNSPASGPPCLPRRCAGPAPSSTGGGASCSPMTCTAA